MAPATSYARFTRDATRLHFILYDSCGKAPSSHNHLSPTWTCPADHCQFINLFCQPLLPPPSPIMSADDGIMSPPAKRPLPMESSPQQGSTPKKQKTKVEREEERLRKEAEKEEKRLAKEQKQREKEAAQKAREEKQKLEKEAREAKQREKDLKQKAKDDDKRRKQEEIDKKERVCCSTCRWMLNANSTGAITSG
jgi:hypothetical protein